MFKTDKEPDTRHAITAGNIMRIRTLELINEIIIIRNYNVCTLPALC